MKKLLLLPAVWGLLFAINACRNTQNSKTAAMPANMLAGTWQLEYITGPRIAFEGLYPDKKPQLIFRHDAMELSGHSSCNGFSAPLSLQNNSIRIGEPRATKMFCPGSGEAVFFNTLKKVNRFSLSGDSSLTLIMGDIAMMRLFRVKS